MVPNRTDIQAKIDEIRQDPTFSTIRDDLLAKVGQWLDAVSCPATDKEKILDDLPSYRGY